MGREVKRVALDFEWPLKKIWQGYINPHYVAKKCDHCDGSGYSEFARHLKDQWYGYAEFTPEKPWLPDHPSIQQRAEFNCRNGYSHPVAEAIRLARDCFNSWQHHLTENDVQALLNDGSLRELTHNWTDLKWEPKNPMPVITAEQVNEWSLSPGTYLGSSFYAVIKARCEKAGVELLCGHCKGDGDIWPSPEAEALYKAWECQEPPSGEGWQMWENTSEGSPISPVFATPEALAHWLADTGASAMGDSTATYEQWLGMIGVGHAPSMMGYAGKLVSGVEFVGSKQPHNES